MLFCFALALASAADPVTSVWIRSTTAAGAMRPEVHSVDVLESEVVVKSAGVSKLYLGELQARPVAEESARQFVFRIPRTAPAKPSVTYGALRGVFTTGVPFYRLGSTAASFQDAGLWRFDRMRGAAIPPLLRNLSEDGSRHSPILGYTLEGSPVYGPWAFGTDGKLQRMRSSYALRTTMKRRTHWPNGLELTPAQEGPAVSAEHPLGTFHEDYVFAEGSGMLDAWNGRFVRTPEYPQGVYAYFVTDTYPYLPAEPFAAAPLARAEFTMTDSKQLEWAFRAADGSLLTRLETAHERPLHLMVISEDLSEFAHVHPEQTSRGTYAIEHRFPKSGKYVLYADFIAPGGAPRIEGREVTVDASGAGAASQGWDAVTMKAPADLRAGRDAELRFDLNVTDLEPYLGAWAHFAIVDTKQRVFIHAHPLEASGVHDHSKPMGPSPRSVIVPVHFPEAGEYRVWAQFQWRGEVRVVPFSLRVREADAVDPIAIPSDAIRVDVTAAGFSPARIVGSSKTVKLAFVRSATSPNCGSKVVFPDLKLQGALQPGAAWVVEVPLKAGEEIRFACGMGMYRGSVVSRVIQ